MNKVDEPTFVVDLEFQTTLERHVFQGELRLDSEGAHGRHERHILVGESNRVRMSRKDKQEALLIRVLDHLNPLRKDRIFAFALQRGFVFQPLRNCSGIRRFARAAGPASHHGQSTDENRVEFRNAFRRILGREPYWKRRVPTHNNPELWHRVGTAPESTTGRTTTWGATTAGRAADSRPRRASAPGATRRGASGVREIDCHLFRPGRLRKNLMDVLRGPTFRLFIIPGIARHKSRSAQSENRGRAYGKQNTSRDHKLLQESLFKRRSARVLRHLKKPPFCEYL